MTVSVVIPTLNGGRTLPRLLDALWQQRTVRPLDIVAVDSGSTDDTLAILTPRVHRLLHVAPGDFDHGRTRNAGIEGAKGDAVVLLVQDATPLSDSWISTLTAPLADPTVAGTFARQVPRPDASALTKRALATWRACSTEPRTVKVEDRAAFDRLPPLEQLDWCAFDNVASCIRRQVWAEHPFPASAIGEDLAWAREVLLAGHRLAFVPDAVVEHSHDRPSLYEYRRTRLLHAQLHQLFNLQTIPTRAQLVRAVATSLATHLRYEQRTPRQLIRAAGLAVAWPLGQYLGARDAVSGRAYRPAAGSV